MRQKMWHKQAASSSPAPLCDDMSSSATRRSICPNRNLMDWRRASSHCALTSFIWELCWGGVWLGCWIPDRSTRWALAGLRCANDFGICCFVWEHYFLHHGLNVWMGSNICLHQRSVQRKGSICLLRHGLFDLCPVQMGCHALWFPQAEATVPNDSSCDPVMGTFKRANRGPRWRGFLQGGEANRSPNVKLVRRFSVQVKTQLS